ncbi:aldo/keto reductase [Pediococcus siamensis]|uniref:aldo/keto reductase n=1 Tax=Pediococcus siamensis TaxID=381829 RepID=UPI0039A167A3
MRKAKIADRDLPLLGMGTWRLGEGSTDQSKQEIAALQTGLDAGLQIIDTAEIYGKGASERLVGEAIQPYAHLVSKFAPWHAGAQAIRAALTGSLQRLGVDYLDLYLYHWPGETPWAETFATLRDLKQEGLIKAYGVSNFTVAQLREVRAVPGGQAVMANELYYNLEKRALDRSQKAFQDQAKITTIGYSPFGSGNGQAIHLPQAVMKIAQEKQISAHQLLLAWTMRDGVISIPKAGTSRHMKENIAAMAVTFSPSELAVIDHNFPIGNQFEMM